MANTGTFSFSYAWNENQSGGGRPLPSEKDTAVNEALTYMKSRRGDTNKITTELPPPKRRTSRALVLLGAVVEAVAMKSFA